MQVYIKQYSLDYIYWLLNFRVTVGEIDRCIKKVAEGVALFEDVWQKVSRYSLPFG